MSLLQQMDADLQAARSAHVNRRFDEGLQLTARYVGPASRNRDFLFLHTRLLHGVNRFADADPILERLLLIDPSNLDATVMRSSGLRYLNRSDEAFVLLEEALSLHPNNGTLLGAYLSLVLTRSGLQVAMQALAREARRSVSRQCLDTAVESFLQKVLSLHDPDELAAVDPDNLLGLRARENTPAYTLTKIYETFEPLGANCEFGFIQRHRGAEPLSLMRWTSITPENLIRLLEQDLAGYDDATHYSLEGMVEKEFILRESAYDTMSHTGVNSADIAPEELLVRLTRRQTFLKRKFLSELSTGQKVYIYKAIDQITEIEMEAIELNLARLGARHTMFTMLTDDPAKIDMVDFQTPTRAIGYLPRKPFSEALTNWDRVIVRAYDRFIGGK